MEAATAGASRGRVWRDQGSVRDAGSQDASREDRATGAGERFFRRGAHQGGLAERNAMIDRTHPLSVVRQCQLLEVARSTAYYQPTAVADSELVLMRRIDELHLQYPFAGARMLRDLLRQDGQAIGRRHVASLMRRMGLTAVCRKPCTTQRHPAHRIYPDLLRHVAITRPNQV